jgi:hypothetical protein
MGLWLSRKRLKASEDCRLVVTVRELFVGASRDAEVLDGLDEALRAKVVSLASLLADHPQRAALLAYIERGTGASEHHPCDRRS